MQNVIERFVEEAGQAEKAGTLDKALEVLLRGFGYWYFTYGFPLKGAELAGAGALTTCDSGWWKHYVDQGYYMHDPLLQQLPYRSLAYEWEETRARATPMGHECLNEAAEAGMTHGLALALRSPGLLYGLSMAGRDEPVDMVERVTIQACAEIYHNKRLCLVAPRKATFNPRELAYIGWMAQGKSQEEVAMIEGVHADAVCKRLRAATERVGTSSSTATILLAEALGESMTHILRVDPGG